MDLITVDTVMCDYITVTTWLSELHGQWSYVFGSISGEKSQFMQYKGMINSGVFVGYATQNDQDHHLVKATGNAAHQAGSIIYSTGGGKATRIDVQQTRYCGVFDAVASREQLRDMRFKRSMTVISGPNGDTLYIGSRSSGRMLRIYQKDTNLVRWEYELKGSVAMNYWTQKDTEDFEGWLASIFVSEYERYGEFFDAIGGRQYYEQAKLQADGEVSGEVERVDGDTIQWLKRQVEPAIKKLKYSHDEQEREWVDGWLEFLLHH